MRVFLALALGFTCYSAIAVCEGCAATPEAAARAALGATASVSPSGVGYRAEEVQVDAVLRRAWVRVRRCDAPDIPAVLVPLSAPVKGVASSSGVTTASLVQELRIVATRQLLVHAGDRVRAVFVSATTRMALQAQAMQSGSEGQAITLVVKRPAGAMADEPEQRIHGVVRAENMVEVIP